MKDIDRQNVVRLGLVSLLNDLGSEVLTRLIPLFVAGVLGAPMAAVGAIEGLADSTATLLKPVFGAWSDRSGKRKIFVTWGYAISAVARPFLAIVGAWPWVAFLRFWDRLGKGVRTAPRDALIADSSRRRERGRHFGINRALDTLGALLGVLAFGAWTWGHGESALDSRTWFQLTLACAVPGFLALSLVILGIQEGRFIARKTEQAAPAAPLGNVFKRYLVVIAIFSLANSSDAFILLRAKELGYSLPGILGMIGLLNVMAASTAIPAAMLSDRLGRRALISLGWSIYGVAYFAMGSRLAARDSWFFILTVAGYGLFYGFTESVERAWIADLAPAPARGRAYGWFGFIAGIAALPSSAGFGYLWDRYGSGVPFTASAALAFIATGLLFLMMPRTIHHAGPGARAANHTAR